MRLIVGLGNPGPRYSGTRHNAGFLVVDAWARRHGAQLRATRYGEEARVGAVRVLKPGTFMNLSGRAVQALATKNGIAPDEILVVHDDLDLPLGRLRVRVGGGAGGQKGIRDIIDRIGPEFARLKIGIDRPPPRWSVEHWVLSRFGDDELDLVDRIVDRAADAVEQVVRDGPEATANAVNGLDLRPPTPKPGEAGDDSGDDVPPHDASGPSETEDA